MKYIANPVEVEAFRITTVGPLADQGGNFRILWLEDGNVVQAGPEMMSRMVPSAGDYWVVQSDGYTYLNPKEVFERKYRAQGTEAEILALSSEKLLDKYGHEVWAEDRTVGAEEAEESRRTIELLRKELLRRMGCLNS